MVRFSISSILQRFRQPNQAESYPTGTIVKFPKDEGKVYAVVIPFEEFRANQAYKYAYVPKKSSIDKGKEVCLRAASGLYISMPTSTLRRIDNLEEELRSLWNKVEYVSAQKQPNIEMMLYELNMNISFLKKALPSR